jgi:hypothetical protein
MQQDSKPMYLSRGHLMLAASKARHQNPSNVCTHSSVPTSQQNPNVPKIVIQATKRTAKNYYSRPTEGPTVKRFSLDQFYGRKETVQGTMPAAFGPSHNDGKTSITKGMARQHPESRSQVRQGCEKLNCFVCGKKAATQSCDLCALMSFCQQCFIMWHNHPDRQNHKQRHHSLKPDEVSRPNIF